MLAAAWAPFFSFSVLAPSASFAETVEPSASFAVAVVMSLFAPQGHIPVLVRLGVRWEQSRVEGSVLIPELLTEPVIVVPVPVEWFRLVPILPPAILPVALVSGHVISSVLPVGFPNSEVETKPTTMRQRWSSSFSPFAAPHTTGHAALRLTATPNKTFRPRMWR